MITLFKQRVGIVCLGSWASELWPQPLVSLHKQLGLIFLLEVTKQRPAKTTKPGLINWSAGSTLPSSVLHYHLFVYHCNEDIVQLPFLTYLVTRSHSPIKKSLISQVISLAKKLIFIVYVTNHLNYIQQDEIPEWLEVIKTHVAIALSCPRLRWQPHISVCSLEAALVFI